MRVFTGDDIPYAFVEKLTAGIMIAENPLWNYIQWYKYIQHHKDRCHDQYIPLTILSHTSSHQDQDQRVYFLRELMGVNQDNGRTQINVQSVNFACDQYVSGRHQAAPLSLDIDPPAENGPLQQYSMLAYANHAKAYKQIRDFNQNIGAYIHSSPSMNLYRARQLVLDTFNRWLTRQNISHRMSHYNMLSMFLQSHYEAEDAMADIAESYESRSENDGFCLIQ